MINSLQAALTKIKNEEPINKIIATQKRTDTVLLGAHVSYNIHKQLKIIAAEESKKQQDLLLEALELLFAKYGKHKI
jgi:hypothetical protein